LENALFFGQVIISESHGQQMHVEALTKAIEFFESLKTEPQIDKNSKRTVSFSDKQNKGLRHKMRISETLLYREVRLYLAMEIELPKSQ